MKTFRPVFLLFFLMAGMFVTAQQQVVVSVVISPPFSTRMSDYTDNPDKIQVQFINTTSQDLEVYVQGRLSGDNGIEIRTDPGYIMPMPVVLPANGVYRLTQDNVQDVFSSEHLLYSGITRDEIVRTQALPEGNYQFCFEVYDYRTHRLLSDAQTGCSNVFVIRYLDPPVIMTPACGSVVQASAPQNVLINWVPALAPGVQVHYRLVMVEMQPAGRDPMDAIMSASPGNYFIEEEDLTLPQLLIDASYPALTEGSNYAFFVQAYDPDNQVKFNNNGTSEVCWFQYRLQQDTTGINPDLTTGFFHDLSIFQEDFRQLPSTQIQGRLFYKLASSAHNTGAYGQAQSMESQGQNEAWNQARSEDDYERSDYVNTGFGTITTSYGGQGTAKGQSDLTANNYSLNDPSVFRMDNNVLVPKDPPFGTGVMNARLFSVNGAKPLANMRVRLVLRLVKKQPGGGFVVVRNPDLSRYHFYDLMGHWVPAQKVAALINKPIAVAVTDEHGNFTFDFREDFLTGAYGMTGSPEPRPAEYPGYLALRVEVENLKFCSPDMDIFALPGDRLTLPEQVALIKDYSVDFKVVSAYDKIIINEKKNTGKFYDTLPKAIPGGEPVTPVKVRILRDMQKLRNEHRAILMAEGSMEGEVIENENGRFKVVYEGITDNKGMLHIDHLVKRWDQVDGKKGSPYYFSVQTRPDDPWKELEFTAYNYEGTFDMLYNEDSHDMGNAIINFSYDHVSGLKYNSEYRPPLSNLFEVELKALRPEIKGHLLSKTNLENISMKNILVFLFNKDTQGADNDILAGALFSSAVSGNTDFPPLTTVKRYRFEKAVKSNDGGFFRFRHLRVNTDRSDPYNPVADGPFRRVQIYSRFFKHTIYPSLHAPAWNLSYGDLKYIKIQLEPRHMLKGEVVDEEGNGVAAYLRVLPDMPYVKTEGMILYNPLTGRFSTKQQFSLPVAENTTNLIEVIPLSHQFYPDTIRLRSLPENNFLEIRVRKKLHRLIVIVKNEKTQQIIRDASIVVGDSLAYDRTGNGGKVMLEFASPGQQFVVKIQAEDFTPEQKVWDIPVSAGNYVIKTVYLKPARSIQGTVTEKNSGRPVQGALVYTELQNTAGHALYLEARSDAQGHYWLKGIPDSYNAITVHVVKEGKNPSYTGTEAQINLNGLVFNLVNGHLTPARYDFQIEALRSDISHIWGFPAVVEAVSRNGNKVERISGYLYDLPGNAVSPLNNDQKVYFKDLRVNDDYGKITPVHDYFYTECHIIPVKLKGGFTGELTNDQGGARPPLMLAKNADTSYIGGLLKLNLSSFNFAYDFHGNIYLGEDTLNARIRPFKTLVPETGNLAGNMRNLLSIDKFYVFDIDRRTGTLRPVPLKGYRLFGFDATSSMSGSYYQGGTIRIGTVLHTRIPLPGGKPDMDLKIKVGAVEITRNDIGLKTTGEPFSFDLEKWKVRSTGNWYFDKNRDAIVLERAVIQTGLGVEAGIRNLLIRPHALREGELDISRGLTLGGVTPLHVNPDLQPVFNYDAGVGHYRISMVGNSNRPAVWTDPLPAMDGRVEFMSMDLLSDNSTEMAIGKNIRFHNLINVYVDQVVSGPGFFTLKGMPDLGIPKMVSSQAGMTYYKENGRVKFRMEPLNAKVDCNANTVFVLGQQRQNQRLEDRLFTAYGKFRIYSEDKNKSYLLEGKLTKTPSEVVIDVVPQDIHVGKEPMHVTGGKITVAGNNWNELHYTAYTRSEGLDSNNKMEYVVHGGVEANSNSISVSNISTPFGELQMAYLFDESALVGHMSITKYIFTGYAEIHSGLMETRFDPKGFYFGIASTMTITQIPVEGGFVVGNYNAPLDEVNAKIYAKMHRKPDKMNSIHGFYFIGEAPLIDKSFDVAGIDVSLKLLIGAFVGGNFNKPVHIEGGGYGFLKAKGGINVVGCGFVGIKSDMFFIMKMLYENGVSLCGCSTGHFTVAACGLEGNLDILSHFRLGHLGKDYDITISSDACPNDPCKTH